jgi:hypothetical protein
MCSCGCGDLVPVAKLKIGEDKYIIINVYPGCQDCTGVIGVDLYFYNRKEMELICDYLPDLEITFDQYGGHNSAHKDQIGFPIPLFDVEDFEQLLLNNKNLENNISEYDNASDYLSDNGLILIQAAISKKQGEWQEMINKIDKNDKTKVKLKSGIERIADERERQINVEGWTAEHDNEHKNSELVMAAAYYAVWGYSSNIAESLYPDTWDKAYQKASYTNIIRNLEKAGALIAAEIDRLQRTK